ncbi:MAG: hypothetical protein FJ224_06715 [Lentisphaerae bacterium]|nr:hypothetical protein [Lentisphaerota bacterium]
MTGVVYRRPMQPDVRSGQSMVELLVGMVAVLALCAGLLEVTSIARRHTDIMVQARQAAGITALWDIEPPLPAGGGPEYIEDWQTGPAISNPGGGTKLGDGKRMTRDDVSIDGSSAEFTSRVVSRAGGAEEWDLMDRIPDNRTAQLRSSVNPSDVFGLAYGAAETDIDLTSPEYSLIRKLLYSPSSGEINLRSDVWMTWTKGIY